AAILPEYSSYGTSRVKIPQQPFLLRPPCASRPLQITHRPYFCCRRARLRRFQQTICDKRHKEAQSKGLPAGPSRGLSWLQQSQSDGEGIPVRRREDRWQESD